MQVLAMYTSDLQFALQELRASEGISNNSYARFYAKLCWLFSESRLHLFALPEDAPVAIKVTDFIVQFRIS